jgi:hypothetical protein
MIASILKSISVHIATSIMWAGEFGRSYKEDRMTFDELVNKILEVSSIYRKSLGNGVMEFYEGDFVSMKEGIKNSDFIFASPVLTRRAEGGNCWDNALPSDYSTGNQARVEDFQEVFSSLFPDMTLKQYLELINILKYKVQIFNYCENEYYGNYSCYETAGLTLCDLDSALIKLGYNND